MAPLFSPMMLDRQQVADLLAAGNLAGLRALLEKAHPTEIAALLEALDEDQRVQVFNLLPDPAAADVLDESTARLTRELVDAVPSETIAGLLGVLPPDDAVGILEDVEEEQAEEILALMEPEEAGSIKTLLTYPEDSAGRLMTTRVVTLRQDWTVDQALAFLRSRLNGEHVLAYLYVVDEGQRLVGVLPIRSLITAPLDRKISTLMDRQVIAVNAMFDQEHVARLVRQYDFFAVPVIDDKGRLLGIITHDDIIDVLHEEFTEDVQRFGGSQPLDEDYLSTPVWTIFRKRAGWLLVLFVTEMLTGTVMRLFQQELQAVVALSFFVPLLIGTGGNSGSQTTSTVIRAIAMGEVSFKDTWRLLWHETRTGFLLGVLMGTVGLVRALTWGSSLTLAVTVALSLFTIVLWANSIGSVLPALASRFKIDPAVISGPVMSTLVDATGLLIYFALAGLIIGL